MRSFSVMFVGLIMLTTLWTGVVFAGTSPSTSQYPEVANLTPFSQTTDYMSLPGYLRYLSFLRLGNWLTYQQAARVVEEERGL